MSDAARSRELAILRPKAIATERGLALVAGHDPDAWPALTAELAAG